MKKAKIMITAIAVLAVVGGALAFKANTFNQLRLYTCVDTQCIEDDDFGTNLKITDVDKGAPVGTFATITNVEPGDNTCGISCSTSTFGFLIED